MWRWVSEWTQISALATAMSIFFPQSFSAVSTNLLVSEGEAVPLVG